MHDGPLPRMRTRTVAGAVLIGFVAAALIATAAEASPSGRNRTGVSKTAPVIIGYADPDGAEQGLQSVGYGARQAIKELHLNWQLKALDDKLSANQQVSDIDTLVSLHAKAIMSWTLDPGAAEAAYQRAAKAGVYVVGLNSQSKTFVSQMAAYTDTTCIVSKQQAAYIASLIPHATVLALGGPPVPSITLTTNCFMKAAKASGLKVLKEQNDTTGTSQGGEQLAANLLTKYPNAQALWVFSESTALGAVAAVHSAGKTVWSGTHKGVVVVSRNGTTAGAAAIRSGNLTATWDNNQPLLGAAAIEIMKMLIVDKVPASKIPKLVPIPSKRWDLTDISQYKSPLSRPVPLPAIPKG